MRIPILSFTFAITSVLSVCAPVCHAQAVAAPERHVAPVQRTPMRPGVRYTTGSYVVSGPGWEKQLTSGNPNLGHWNWIPVIGYTQSTGTTSKQAVQAPAVAEHKSVYVKPNHVALPVVNHGTPRLATREESLLPVKVPPPVHLNKQSPTEDNSAYSTRTQAVLSYTGDYHGNEGFRSSSSVHGVLAHKNVGALLSQSMRY
jgi:hypothetical protein